MTRKILKTIENIILLPFAILLLMGAVETIAFLGGFVFLGIIKFDDIDQLFSSPVFHGVSFLIALSMILHLDKIKQKLLIWLQKP